MMSRILFSFFLLFLLLLHPSWDDILLLLGHSDNDCRDGNGNGNPLSDEHPS